jgi:fatty acid desaturase
MTPDSALTPPRASGRFFAYSGYDWIPVVAAVAHLAYLLFLFFVFPHLRWWQWVPLALVYSISISWNINGISHNFLHNPYFRSPALNRAFSLLESLTCGFSQVFYEQVHKEHHMGNADLPDEHGRTVDPLSIYKHGHDGKAESVWTYVFCSYFRDDPGALFAAIKRRGRAEAIWGVVEIVAFIAFFAAMFVANWRFMLWFVPFYYLGHCLSYLNGYYLHFGGKPGVPLAWGVSSYHLLYNWLWFNNGYHAEHHYRPRVHWTQMKQLREQLREEQERAGTRVIRPPHALGFLEPLGHAQTSTSPSTATPREPSASPSTNPS